MAEDGLQFLSPLGHKKVGRVILDMAEYFPDDGVLPRRLYDRELDETEGHTL